MADPISTCATLVNAGLRIAGITGRPLRVPSTDQSTEAIGVLNRMLGSWNIAPLRIFSETISTFPLVAGQQTYFIGPTGPDFIAPRPIDITRANIILANTGVVPIHYHLTILEVVDWAELTMPALTSGAWPTRLYRDRAMPNSRLYLYPVEGEGDTLELFTPLALQQFLALTDTVSLPDGYEDAITFNLAVRLAAYYPTQAQMAPNVPGIAAESLARVESANAPVPYLQNDAAGFGDNRRGGESRWWLMGGDLGK